MATAQTIDFAAIAPDIAGHLFGDPNRRLSSKDELRFGSHGSMSVDLGTGRYYDHEAKTGGGMLDLIQRERKCDVAGALSWLEDLGLKDKDMEPVRKMPGVAAPRTGGEVFYDYRDEAGLVLSRVRRSADKRFYQLGPDGKGGFHAAKGCMDGVRRVPYRLPELIGADPGRAVFIVEGEKDADRLASLGFIATCNSQGAGKFGFELTPFFADRRVVILPDNDDAGRNHAIDVAAKLLGTAAAVAILDLPGLPHKGDVSDWLDAGGSTEDLKDMARSALDRPMVMPEPANDAGPLVSATPFAWRDPATVPPRQWIYGRQLLRGTVTLVVAPGATGKSALMVGTILSLTTGRALLDKQVWEGPKRVWYFNLEDQQEELDRLILAAARHWRIGPADLGNRLYVDSAMDGRDLKIAVEDHAGFRIIAPVEDALIAELKAKAIDVLIIDPFVSVHQVNENDNAAIDAVAKTFSRIAVKANCSVVLVHHTRKLAGAEVNAESSRGAKALIDAARSALTLNRMSEDEASRYGIEGEDRRRYFRVYDDKGNRAPPADSSDWYRLASVELGNGRDGHPGDNMQVVLPWTPPDAFEGITVDHLRKVQAAISAGDWRESSQSPQWAGYAVAEVLGLDGESKADKKRIGAMLKTWVANGALIAEEGKDDRRKPVKFVRVGRPADDVAPPQKVERSKVEQIRPETCSTTTPYRGWGVERSSAPGENQGGANRPVWMDEEDPAVAGFEQGRGLGV